jgi:hypothetical protein
MLQFNQRFRGPSRGVRHTLTVNAKNGYEAVHMMRKGQVRWLPGHDAQGQIRFVDRLFGLST